MEESDTLEGGETLSIDEAAAAFAKLTTEEADAGQSDVDEPDEGETTDDELQASDEDASEDADGETDDEGQAEESGEDEEPESDQGRFVASNGKVRLPDGTVSTVSELIQGNLRDRDYRQKTMELAEQRRAAEAQSSAFEASEKQLAEQREYVTQLLQSIVPQAPDPSLLQSDPMGYMTQNANHEQWMAHLNHLQQEQQRTEQERQAKSQQEERETANREWAALLGKVPELADKKRSESFVAEAVEHGASYGFTRKEIGQIGLDHRQALVLRDAIAWRKLQASKASLPKKVEGRPPVTKGGKRLNPSEQRSRRASDAITRLKKSGSVEDAAAAYLASQKG